MLLDDSENFNDANEVHLKVSAIGNYEDTS